MLPFEHELSESLIAALGRVLTRAPEELADLIADLDLERAPQASALMVDATAMLRLAGPMVSTYWLNDTLQRVLSPVVPRLHNSDGEDMEIFALHYRLEQGVSAETLRIAPGAAPDLDPASATFWNCAEECPTSPREAESPQGHRLHLSDGARRHRPRHARAEGQNPHVSREFRASR